MRLPLYPLRGHTVDTAQVAAVCNRNPQVGNLAVKAVFKHKKKYIRFLLRLLFILDV